MNKLVIIVGAGASAALAPREIPVMNNFFEIAADFAQGDKQVAKTLKALRRFLLSSHPERSSRAISLSFNVYKCRLRKPSCKHRRWFS